MGGRRVTVEEFLSKMQEGGTVPLHREEWEALAPSFPEVERHNTQLAGDLILVRMGTQLAAVEQPSREARVARLFKSEKEARAFLERRLEEYERMWDGCGVKIEYYEES
jgi:hypothetical protein